MATVTVSSNSSNSSNKRALPLDNSDIREARHHHLKQDSILEVSFQHLSKQTPECAHSEPIAKKNSTMTVSDPFNSRPARKKPRLREEQALLPSTPSEDESASASASQGSSIQSQPRQPLSPTESIRTPQPNDILLQLSVFRQTKKYWVQLRKHSSEFNSTNDPLARIATAEKFIRALRCINDSSSDTNTIDDDNNNSRFLISGKWGYREATESQILHFVVMLLGCQSFNPWFSSNSISHGVHKSVPDQPKFKPLAEGFQPAVDPFVVCFSKTKKEFFTPQENLASFLAPFQSFCQSQEFIDFCQKSQLINVRFRLVLNNELVHRFIHAVADGACSFDQRIGVVFHGTRPKNVEPILQNGLNPNLRRRQAHGPGEYFSTNPSRSLSYASGSSQMLVFAVVLPVPRNQNNDGTGSAIAYRVGASHPVVVENNLHQLPLGVISWDDTVRSRRRRRLIERRALRARQDQSETCKLMEKLQTMVNRTQVIFIQQQQQQQQQQKDKDGIGRNLTLSESWHNDQQMPERRLMICLVTNLLKYQKNFNAMWYPKLPEMARHLELLLYLNATSHVEYSNTSTLLQRLGLIMEKLAKKHLPSSRPS